MKKMIYLLVFCVALFSFAFKTSALTTYNYNDWYAQDGYGSKEKISDNITNLKGKYDEDMGMSVGPYSKKSSTKLKDGITEEVNVEINFDNMDNDDLFEITLGLKNSDDQYVSEAVVTTQKTKKDEVRLSATWAPKFSLLVKESGIYTYRWKMFIKDDVTYVNFTLLNYDTVVGTTGDINLDEIKTNDTKTPIVKQKDVSVKYLWFCNIKANKGVNVYTVLPERAVVNPNTKDNVSLYFCLATISLVLIMFLFKNKQYD